MNNWKDIAEIKLEIFSDFIFENKLKLLIFILLITIALISQIKHITLDSSTEEFLKKDDSYRIAYDKFREQFGREEKALIIIKTDNIFDLEFIKTLNKLHKELENNLPYARKVSSLINVKSTIGDTESFIGYDLFDKIPDNQKDMDIKKKLAYNIPLLKGVYISGKGDITAIIIESDTYSNLELKPLSEEDEFSETETKDIKLNYLTAEENKAMSRKIQEIVAKYTNDNFKTYVSGSIIITDEIKAYMEQDMQFFMQALIIIITLLLLALFRRASAIFLPMLTASLSIVSTISMMAIFSVPITIMTQILPSFLLSVTIGASIHFLSIFYKRYDLTKDKKASLRYTMGHSGLSIIMTSITTTIGLFAFSFSEVAHIANLGLFASLGTMIGLAFSIVLLPVLLSIFNIKTKEIKVQDGKVKENLMNRTLLSISHISTRYPEIIIIISAYIVCVAILIITEMRFSYNPMHWLKPDSKIRIATDFVDKNFRGLEVIEIVIDTKKEYGLYDPKILKAIDNLSHDLLTIKSEKYYIGKTFSIVDVLKETNQALHENDKRHYSISENKNLIAQELFIFSNLGIDEMRGFVDSKFSKARISMKIPVLDAIYYADLQKEIDAKIAIHFNDDIEIYTISSLSMLSRVMSAAIYSSAFSYIIAYFMITIIMILIIGDIKIGLISMIPNIIPIFFIVSVMVIFDMPLDLFTMLIGSIVTGIAVDDTVHFMHGFNKYYKKYKNVDIAVEKTLLSIGRAMMITTIIISLGFLVFIGSSMLNLVNFGILTAIAILMALVADFFLMPAIVKVMIRKDDDEKYSIT